MIDVIQKEETQETDSGSGGEPLRHAYCRRCCRINAPNKIKARCGGGKGLNEEMAMNSGNWSQVAPRKRCVVCEDLSRTPCPNCGE